MGAHGGYAMNEVFHRLRLLAGAVIGLALAGTGCNVLQVPYFLFAMEDPKHEPEIQKIASKNKKEERKVVILTYHRLDLRPEFINSDRELTHYLERSLRQLFETNKEKVTIVPARKVEDYKMSHPDWHESELASIGEYFKADWVIYLEMNHLGLYEPGSGGTLYRGKADMTISLVDVKKPEDSPPPQAFTCSYPRESRMQLTTTDKSPAEFRQMFMEYLGKRVSWKFTSHPTRDDFYAD